MADPADWPDPDEPEPLEGLGVVLAAAAAGIALAVLWAAAVWWRAAAALRPKPAMPQAAIRVAPKELDQCPPKT